MANDHDAAAECHEQPGRRKPDGTVDPALARTDIIDGVRAVPAGGLHYRGPTFTCSMVVVPSGILVTLIVPPGEFVMVIGCAVGADNRSIGSSLQPEMATRQKAAKATRPTPRAIREKIFTDAVFLLVGSRSG